MTGCWGVRACSQTQVLRAQIARPFCRDLNHDAMHLSLALSPFFGLASWRAAAAALELELLPARLAEWLQKRRLPREILATQRQVPPTATVQTPGHLDRSVQSCVYNLESNGWAYAVFQRSLQFQHLP